MSRVSPRFFFYWKWDVSQRQCSELITEGFPAVSGKPKSKEYGVMRKEKKKTLLYPQPQFPFSDTLSMSWQLVPDPNVSMSGACATFFFFFGFYICSFERAVLTLPSAKGHKTKMDPYVYFRYHFQCFGENSKEIPIKLTNILRENYPSMECWLVWMLKALLDYLLVRGKAILNGRSQYEEFCPVIIMSGPWRTKDGTQMQF